jgi:drug/metabolite transporter (DMT)-like permease
MPLWVIPISFLIFFEIVADVLAKEYSLRGGWLFWSLAILGYITANSFWLYAIRHGSGLARGAIIFSVGSAVFAVLLGVLIYKEQITTLRLTGLVLGIIALTLLLWE